MAKAKNEAPTLDAVGAPLDLADETLAPHAGEQIMPAVPERVRARVLCACDFGAPNDVVEVDEATAKARADVLDTDPAAVAYAESQRF